MQTSRGYVEWWALMPSFVQDCDCVSHKIDLVDFGLTQSNSWNLGTLKVLHHHPTYPGSQLNAYRQSPTLTQLDLFDILLESHLSEIQYCTLYHFMKILTELILTQLNEANSAPPLNTFQKWTQPEINILKRWNVTNYMFLYTIIHRAFTVFDSLLKMLH